MKQGNPWVIESNQNNATITNTGICTTLPAAMGMGGGYIPMVLEISVKEQKEKDGEEIRDYHC